MSPKSPNTPGLRLVFAGTPDFAAAHLSALLAQAKHQVIAAYTQPDRPAGRGKQLQASPVKQVALNHSIAVCQPASLKPPEAQAKLASLNPDLLLVVAYGLLLPQAVLDIPRLGCINVHASLLPRWRGAAPIQRAIEAGDRETGITLMQMDAGLDTGPLLNSVRCAIGPRETGGSLHDKLAGIGATALLNSLDRIAAGELAGEPQDNRLSCYAPKIGKAEAEIDWSQPAEVLERKIRAFNPFPVTFSLLNSQRVRLWMAEAPKNTSCTEKNVRPGAILHANSDGLLIACGEGVLRVQEIQLPGKTRLPVAEVLKGHQALFTPGTRFGA